MQQSQKQLILVMGLVTAFVIFGGTIYLLSRHPESGPAGPASSAGATANATAGTGIPDTGVIVTGNLQFPGEPKPTETKEIQSTPTSKILWVFNDTTVTVTLPALHFSHVEKVVYLDSQDQYQFIFRLPDGPTAVFPLAATVTIHRPGFKDAVLDNQQVGADKRLALPPVSLTR